MVMKYRVARLSVTVTGPPASIWRRNTRATLPRDSRTFPKRTAQRMRHGRRDAACMYISPRRFAAPITPAGRTALSVETTTTRDATYRDRVTCEDRGIGAVRSGWLVGPWRVVEAVSTNTVRVLYAAM